LHHPQPLKWRLIVQLDQSLQNIEQATTLTASIISRRLDLIDVQGAKVDVIDAKAGRIQIQLPDVADRERLKTFLTSGGKLEIVHVISPPYPGPINLYANLESAKSQGPQQNIRVLPFNEPGTEAKRWAIVELPALVTNFDVRNARAIPTDDGVYHVAFNLRQEAAQRFASWTGNHIHEYVGVVLNDEIKSTAYIKSQLADSGEISGNFTKASAEDLAQILISGPLPSTLHIIEDRNT
jgi:preprotein translocase subunit SecD